MLPPRALLAAAVSCVLFAGCDDQKKPSAGYPGASSSVAQTAPSVARHLGFATRVPADVDVFISGYHLETLLTAWLHEISETKLRERMEETDAGRLDSLDEIRGHIGDEAFLFISPGAHDKLRTAFLGYQQANALAAGMYADLLLSALVNPAAPDFSKIEESIQNDLMERMFDSATQGLDFRVPGIVMGWQPAGDKLETCRGFISENLGKLMEGIEHAEPVTFSAHGVELSGFQMKGREAFAPMIEKGHAMLQKNADAEGAPGLSPELMERALEMLENLRLTVATGVSEGRVLLYFGDGGEGFRLADSEQSSLAASPAFLWTLPYKDNRTFGAMHLSRDMVAAVLPLLDDSPQYEALAKAVRDPIQDQRLFSELFQAMAETSRALSRREPHPWSAVIFEDEGLRLETRGGMVDPSIDFSRPLAFSEPTAAMAPAIRAHWVQARAYNDLTWTRVEQYSLLLHAIYTEFLTARERNAAAGEGVTEAMILSTLSILGDELRELNRSYRDEFRAGIGDEVAFLMAFDGEVPPIPGISENIVANGKAPRFLIARPVTDPAGIHAAGASMAASWRKLTGQITEKSGMNVPLILPQPIEHSGLTTWYPPLPFIGGDFIPGVSMNDSLWMLGTSKSMASDFAKAATSASTGSSETGVRIEIDFRKIREWIEAMAAIDGKSPAEHIGEASEEVAEFASPEDIERALDGLKRLESLSYRKDLDGGVPRVSLHLRISPAQD